MDCTWEVYEVTLEAMESLPLKFFCCKARLGRLSNEMQEATFEDPDHISFEIINLFKHSLDKFETSKQRVRDKIKCHVLLVATISTVKYLLLHKNFSENSASACFENMRNKFVITWVSFANSSFSGKTANLSTYLCFVIIASQKTAKTNIFFFTITNTYLLIQLTFFNSI